MAGGPALSVPLLFFLCSLPRIDEPQSGCQIMEVGICNEPILICLMLSTCQQKQQRGAKKQKGIQKKSSPKSKKKNETKKKNTREKIPMHQDQKKKRKSHFRHFLAAEGRSKLYFGRTGQIACTSRNRLMPINRWEMNDHPSLGTCMQKTTPSPRLANFLLSIQSAKFLVARFRIRTLTEAGA